MGRFILVPVGEHAKQHCADGLPLWATDKPVLLGRGVRPSDGYKYPNEWNSLSTRHCQLSFATEAQGPGYFLVTDTSTNGTYVYSDPEQKVKIGKNNTQELRVGQYLGLSVVPSPANATLQFINTIEYRLEYEENALPAAPPAAGATAPTPAAPSSANKRKQGSSPMHAHAPSGDHAPAGVDGEASSVKRQRQETPEVLLMRQKNEELRAKVAECHKQIGELDQQLRDKEESHAAEKEERSREVQDLQDRLSNAAKRELELNTKLDIAKAQLLQREEALMSTTNELELKDQRIRELEAAAALIQAELHEKAAAATAAAQTTADLQLQLAAAQEQAADAGLQLQKQQHAAAASLQEARTRAAEAEKEYRKAAAQLRAAHSERALLWDKVESERELLNVFSNQTEMVLSEAAAKQAQLSAQAEAITNIMNQLIAGHASFSKHLRSKQSELKLLLEPGTLAAVAAAEGTTATAAGGASSMGSLEDARQEKRRQLQGSLHDAGHVSGSQVTTGHNSEANAAAAGVPAAAGQAAAAGCGEVVDQQHQQQQTPLSLNKTQVAGATPATTAVQYGADIFDDATQDNNDFPSTMEYNVPNNLLGTLVAADELQAAAGPVVGPQGTPAGQQQQQMPAGAVGGHDRGIQQGAADAAEAGADPSASHQEVTAPSMNVDMDDDEMVDAEQDGGTQGAAEMGTTTGGVLRVVAASEEDAALAAGAAELGALVCAAEKGLGESHGSPNQKQQDQEQQQHQKQQHEDVEDEFDDLEADDGTESPERRAAEGGAARGPAASVAAPGLAAGSDAAGDRAARHDAGQVEAEAEHEGDETADEEGEEQRDGEEDGRREVLQPVQGHHQQQHQQHDLLGLLPGIDTHSSIHDHDASGAAAAGCVPGDKSSGKAIKARHLLGSAAPSASSPAEPCLQPKGALVDIGNHVGIAAGSAGENPHAHHQQQRWGGGAGVGSGYDDGY